MTIEIESGVPIPRCEPATPRNVTKAMQAYSEAYRALYGIDTEVSWDGAYVRVRGQSAGMKLNALRRATRQLIYRAG